MTDARNRPPERRTFAKGTIIFREGDLGDKAYLVQAGTVRIFKTVGGKRVTIGHVRPFQVFGELSMMDDSPRMAGALADDEVTCLVLEKDAIHAMMEQAPPGLNSLLMSLLSTMRSMGKELAEVKALLQERGIET